VLHAGLILIPQGVGALAARVIVGKLVDRCGARAVTIASFLLAAAAQALLKTGLAPAPTDADPSELAAWTNLARVLLNLHETITRS